MKQNCLTENRFSAKNQKIFVNNQKSSTLECLKSIILNSKFYFFLPYYNTGYSFFLFFIFFTFIVTPQNVGAIAKHHSVPLPLMVPIRYDLQIQLPTASAKDPLVPTFFGSTRIDFQLTSILNSINVVSQLSTSNEQYWLVLIFNFWIYLFFPIFKYKLKLNFCFHLKICI